MKKIKYLLPAALLVLMASYVNADELASKVISATNAYVRAVPTGATNTAAFMSLKNNGQHVHHLIAAYTPIAQQTQLHVTFFEKGVNEFAMARMRQVHDFVIKPAATESFKPGSHHIMLMGLTQSLTSGQVIPITLIFSDGSSEQVNAVVKNITS